MTSQLANHSHRVAAGYKKYWEVDLTTSDGSNCMNSNRFCEQLEPKQSSTECKTLKPLSKVIHTRIIIAARNCACMRWHNVRALQITCASRANDVVSASADLALKLLCCQSRALELVLWLWRLAPSFSLLLLRSARHIYMRPNCWYTPCLPARLHKGVLKGIFLTITSSSIRSEVSSKIHTSICHIFSVGTIAGRHKQTW